MSSLNKSQIIGNLTRDPEIRTMTSGDRVASFSVATSEKWKDRAGEQKEKTEFHNVVVFNENLANLCEKYLKKGSKVYIEGALQTRKWTDQSGNDKYTTEIVIKSFNGNIVLLGGNSSSSETRQSQAKPEPDNGFDVDDLIPF
jgi:single-strand DNA-binding protein